MITLNMVGYSDQDNMGLSRRKKSGNIMGGSTLNVDGQGIYSVKVFPPTFNNKTKIGGNTTITTTQPNNPTNL
jgi:hypothetical protein